MCVCVREAVHAYKEGSDVFGIPEDKDFLAKNAQDMKASVALVATRKILNAATFKQSNQKLPDSSRQQVEAKRVQTMLTNTQVLPSELIMVVKGMCTKMLRMEPF